MDHEVKNCHAMQDSQTLLLKYAGTMIVVEKKRSSKTVLLAVTPLLQKLSKLNNRGRFKVCRRYPPPIPLLSA